MWLPLTAVVWPHCDSIIPVLVLGLAVRLVLAGCVSALGSKVSVDSELATVLLCLWFLALLLIFTEMAAGTRI